MLQPRTTLSRHAWAGLEKLIDRFEDAWHAGGRPVIEEYLPAEESQRQVVLVELVHADLERRLQAGEAARVEEYLTRFPDLAEDADAVLPLLAAEYELRRETDARVTPAEYQTRFPALAAELPLYLKTRSPGPADPTPHPTEALNGVAPARRPPTDTTLPTVPGYEIAEEIGRGGMGVVYKARHERLGRWVALKMVLAGAHAGRTERERFRAEAEAAARLQHPNIVQVHEVGEHDGRPYLALEYVAGSSLAQRLAGQPLPPKHAAAMVETLARAMHYAHQQGVIHRDLKPANILVSGGVVSGGVVNGDTPHPSPLTTHQYKITDFGLAKRLGATADLTCSGAILGTPSYIAPEQVEGRAKRVGPGADVYALGAILYEMLTGRPPFQGATPLETLEQVRVQEPVTPRRLAPKVPHDLEVICLKCLAKEPRRRYPSAADLADDLHRFLEGVPIQARPVSTTEHVVKWVRRRPAVALLTAAVVAVSVIGVAGLAWQWQQTRAGLAKAEDNLYANRIALADREWLAGHVDHTRQLLEECPPGRRAWEWHYLRRLCQRAQHTLPAGGAFSVALEGRYLAVAAADEEAVHVWDLETGQRVLSLAGTGLGVAISPDGKRLASATWKLGPGGELLAEQVSDVKVWELPSGREVLRLPGHKGTVFSLVFTPDGKRLASASLDGTAKVWDLTAGREVLTYRPHGNWVEAVAFGPDGKLVASAGADGTVRVWNAATGHEQVVLTDDKSPAGRLVQTRMGSMKGDTQAPRGRGGEANAPLKVWDPESGKTILPLRGQTHALASVAFSPDGKRIAAGQGNAVRVWDVATRREIHALRGHTDLVRDVAFDATSTRLVSASYDQTIKVWDLATGEETTTFRGHTGPVNRVAFSRDGQRVASASWDGTAKVWDVATSGEVLVVRGHRDFARGLAFAPDGSRLATAGADRLVMVCNSWTGKTDLTFTAHADTANAVAFSNDGTRLATAGYDGTVRLWDAATGAALGTFTGHKGLVYRVAFSPDGNLLASAGHDGTVRFWDVPSGTEKQVLRGHTGRIFAVVFHPNGSQVASAGDDRTVRLWDVDTGKLLRTLEGHGNDVTGVVFSRDGRRLASSSLDRTAKVWDTATGAELVALRGHVNGVTAVAFSPDGQRLATASLDRGVRLWNAATGQEMLALRGPMLEVLGVTFSPDGHRLAAATAEGAAYIWDATPLTE